MTRLSHYKWLLAATLFSLIPQVARPQAAASPLPRPGAESASQALHFSGYDWTVKTSQGNVGPGPNVFGKDGVRVDGQGRLHLAIAQREGRWVCSEVVSKRSFGYGEYRFVVRGASHLDVNAVLGMFLWETSAPEDHFREVDIELSRWSNAGEANAQFVVQPYSLPENLDRFELPPGRAVLSFRWSPGRLFCRALVDGRVVREHVFTQGVPVPGHENVRINLWLYRAAPPANGKAVEVELESFRFLPLTRSTGKGK